MPASVGARVFAWVSPVLAMFLLRSAIQIHADVTPTGFRITEGIQFSTQMPPLRGFVTFQSTFLHKYIRSGETKNVF